MANRDWDAFFNEHSKQGQGGGGVQSQQHVVRTAQPDSGGRVIINGRTVQPNVQYNLNSNISGDGAHSAMSGAVINKGDPSLSQRAAQYMSQPNQQQTSSVYAAQQRSLHTLPPQQSNSSNRRVEYLPVPQQQPVTIRETRDVRSSNQPVYAHELQERLGASAGSSFVQQQPREIAYYDPHQQVVRQVVRSSDVDTVPAGYIDPRGVRSAYANPIDPRDVRVARVPNNERMPNDRIIINERLSNERIVISEPVYSNDSRTAVARSTTQGSTVPVQVREREIVYIDPQNPNVQLVRRQLIPAHEAAGI